MKQKVWGQFRHAPYEECEYHMYMYVHKYMQVYGYLVSVWYILVHLVHTVLQHMANVTTSNTVM